MDDKRIPDNKFKPIEIKRAPESIFDQIEEMIHTGQLKPGDKLPPERKLMEVYKRSHPTIREALRLLESAGYITVVPGDGAIVREVTSNPVSQPLDELLRFRKISLHDVMEFIIEGEPSFAGYAAARRTWEDTVSLELQLKKMSDASNSANIYFKDMIKFHLLMVQSSHNPLASIVWNGIGGLIENNENAFLQKINWDINKTQALHRILLSSIREQKTEKAAEADTACWESCKEIIKVQIAKQYENIDKADQKDSNESIVGFAPIQTKKASQLIYEQICEMILNGELQPGEKIPPERELSTYFNRSRPTIREALKMLEMKDYVTISRGSGTVVNKLSTFEIERAINYMLRFNLVSRLDILEMRNICETIAASWASDRRTQKDIDVMQGILEHSKTVIEDRAAFISCGIDFTNSMARSSKNDLIYIISRMTSMFSHDRYSNKTSLAEMLKEHNTILLQHQEILQAISDKDAELTKTLVLKHLNEVSEILS